MDERATPILGGWKKRRKDQKEKSVETGDNLDKVTSDETEDNLEFYWEDGVKKLRQNK